jgi:tetratricopeptide (TPR) repeat protein
MIRSKFEESTNIKIRVTAKVMVLTMVLTVFAGCAANRNTQSVLDDHQAQEMTGPSITPLADGREGFLIVEVPQMDDASRRDFELAVTMLNDQDYSQAIELLEKIIAQSPGVTAPYINAAIGYRAIGKPDLAEGHLKTALEMVPGHPVACNEYGLLYRKSGRFAEARAMYETSLTNFPNYYPVHKNLGILCDLYLNDLACALEHYEIYSQAMPEDRQVNIWITDLRSRLGRE